jgi:hypothetical protein
MYFTSQLVPMTTAQTTALAVVAVSAGIVAHSTQHVLPLLLLLLLLLQAIPILNDALAALDTIKEVDIAYIKKLQNPPSAIKLVLEAVCVVLDAKPVKVRLAHH